MTNNKRLLKIGKGWRIGWDASADKYKGLVGADDWAVELTGSELQDFCRLLAQLSQTMTEMSEHLMAEEKVACEAESDLLWLQVEGYPHAYSLHCIINQDRRCEGHWPEDAVKELIQAAQTLTVF
jgi:hypothetical protein